MPSRHRPMWTQRGGPALEDTTSQGRSKFFFFGLEMCQQRGRVRIVDDDGFMMSRFSLMVKYNLSQQL